MYQTLRKPNNDIKFALNEWKSNQLKSNWDGMQNVNPTNYEKYQSERKRSDKVIHHVTCSAIAPPPATTTAIRNWLNKIKKSKVVTTAERIFLKRIFQQQQQQPRATRKTEMKSNDQWKERRRGKLRTFQLEAYAVLHTEIIAFCQQSSTRQGYDTTT